MKILWESFILCDDCHPVLERHQLYILKIMLLIGGVEQNPGPKKDITSFLPLHRKEGKNSSIDETILEILSDSQKIMRDIRQEINELKLDTQKEIHSLQSEINKLKKQVDKQEYEIQLLTPVIPGLREQIASACYNGDWKRCEELLEIYLDEESTAYRKFQDAKGYVILPLSAAERGCTEVIHVLLKNGLPINQEYSGMYVNHFTMLHAAAKYGQYELVKFLIMEGAEIEIPDCAGEVPLHLAAFNGYVDILKLLIDNGANVNVLNNNGDTPLHLAAYWGHVAVVDYLISCKCDTLVTNKQGETPLDLAEEKEYSSIVEILST